MFLPRRPASRSTRPHLLAGIGLPIRAVVVMAKDPEERAPLVLVISLLIVGAVFYPIVEGWSILDAVFFSTMSLATVGYGDLVPTTSLGKIFTIVYVLGGIGTLVSFFTTLTALTLKLQQQRRRERENAKA